MEMVHPHVYGNINIYIHILHICLGVYLYMFILCHPNLDEIPSQKPPLCLNFYIQVKYLISIPTSCVAIQINLNFEWTSMIGSLHPPSSTQSLKRGHFKRKVVFPPSCFKGYVSFRWSKWAKRLMCGWGSKFALCWWLQFIPKISIQTETSSLE